MSSNFIRQTTFQNGTTADGQKVENEFVAVDTAFVAVEGQISALGLGTLVPVPTTSDIDKPVVVNAAGSGYALKAFAPFTLASATQTLISTSTSTNIIMSGTATVTSFDTMAAGIIRYVTASGAFTLTHNATSLILPGAANIVAAVNDAFILKSLGSGNWQVIDYQKADGRPFLGIRNTWTAAQGVAQVTLTDAATIATDASLSNVFLVTLGGNRTLGNPTNLVAGQSLTWNIRQDATGSRTLAYGALFKFRDGIAPILSTAANAKNVLNAVYDGVELICEMWISPTAAGLALLDDADAAAQRTTLGAAASGDIANAGLTIAGSKLAGSSTTATGALAPVSIGTGLTIATGTLSLALTTAQKNALPRAIFTCSSTAETTDVLNNVTFVSYTKDVGANTATLRVDFDGASVPTLTSSNYVAVGSCMISSMKSATFVDSNTLDFVFGYWDNVTGDTDNTWFNPSISLWVKE